MWEERRMTVATTHCSFYRFILDKREEFWNDGKSGMSYFSILRLSIKWQIIRDFNTPTTLKRTSNRPSCLWKRLTLHTCPTGRNAKSPGCARRPTRHGGTRQCVVCVHGGWMGPAHDMRWIVKNDERKTSDEVCHPYMIPIPMERRRRSKETEVGGYEGTTVQQYSSNVYFTYTYQVSIKIY